MNNSDTPETDRVLAEVKQHQIAFFTQESNFGGGIVTWENPIVTLCKRLERERDEALELAQQMSESNQVLQAEVREYRKKAESGPTSSNETNLKLALEQVAKLAKALKEERDEARELADSCRIAFCSASGADKTPNPFPWESKS
jgi:predicted RNase H-like nuclease (RuvC/YqgF family)